MEMRPEHFQMGIAVFGAMLVFVWILPGVVCRIARFPEDRPSRK